MSDTGELRLAVLIDAENVPYKNIKGILEEVAKYGTPTIKRIYADWTSPAITGWRTLCSRTPLLPSSNTAILPAKTPPTPL
jgi:hypothetical protein